MRASNSGPGEGQVSEVRNSVGCTVDSRFRSERKPPSLAFSSILIEFTQSGLQGEFRTLCATHPPPSHRDRQHGGEGQKTPPRHHSALISHLSPPPNPTSRAQNPTPRPQTPGKFGTARRRPPAHPWHARHPHRGRTANPALGALPWILSGLITVLGQTTNRQTPQHQPLLHHKPWMAHRQAVSPRHVLGWRQDVTLEGYAGVD